MNQAARSVLVTGAGGFIGRLLAAALSKSGDAVLGVDVPAALDGTDVEWEMEPLDITDTTRVRALMRRHGVTHVVHAAAVVGVRASAGGPLQAANVNIVGSVGLWDAAADQGVQRVVDLSSEEYYGDFPSDRIDEEAPALPGSPYGVTKFAAERFGHWYAQTRALPYVAARLSWVYGPGFPRERLPHTWLRDAARGVPSRLDSGGDQALDFTYVDDAVDGVVALLNAGRLEHRAYHVAGGRSTTVRELADLLRQLAPEWEVTLGDGPLELAPGVAAHRKGALDCQRIREELGWRPRVSLEEGLHRTLQHLRDEESAS